MPGRLLFVTLLSQVAGGGLKFDTKKLISWPGFNSELPKEFKDEGQKYEDPAS